MQLPLLSPNFTQRLALLTSSIDDKAHSTEFAATQPTAMALLYLCAALAASLFITGVDAYIPASPTNITGTAGGPNVTDVSKLHLQWYSTGCVAALALSFLAFVYLGSRRSYWENVSYQLVGNGSNGVSQGALVHFSEQTVNNDSAASE